MIRWAMLGVIVAMAGACSSAPVRIDSRALGNQVNQSSDRFIIVAVDNVPAAFVAHAGGTPHGYDAGADYGATAQAHAALRALERGHGLREVNASPIDPLHIHCAVLEIPSAAERNKLLSDPCKDRPSN